jgi:hypothetical protein
MSWFSRLFGRKTEEESASRRELASKIAQAGSGLGNTMLTMLNKMEEMLDKPLSADECQSAEKSLNSLESTLSVGVVPANQVKDARERIRMLRQKLSQVKTSPATNKVV